MPLFQTIFEFTKNLEAPKEDTDKLSPNAGTAASMIKSYQLNHSACKELPFDILHAYLESNMQAFQESGSSKKKTRIKPLPMLQRYHLRSNGIHKVIRQAESLNLMC